MTNIRAGVYLLLGMAAGIACATAIVPAGRDALGQGRADAVTVHSLRIVDSRGRTTAFLGNLADGRSPAILLYDASGKVRAAVMVDSVTGQTVPIAGQSRAEKTR